MANDTMFARCEGGNSQISIRENSAAQALPTENFTIQTTTISTRSRGDLNAFLSQIGNSTAG
eukprot:COSAG02_NODE_5895_length_3956_cov_1.928442_2_plen_62_part_00